MSSDPIEVLRRIVELARRHEGHDPQLREALASLSAPKPPPMNDNAVAVNESAPVNDKPESAEAVGWAKRDARGVLLFDHAEVKPTAADYAGLEDGETFVPLFTAPPRPEASVRCGDERYELDAYLWRRESTQEWVLELSGTINDASFTNRFPVPLSYAPEDAVSLPNYVEQPAAVDEAMVEKAAEAAWLEFKSGLEERSWERAPAVRKDRLRIIVRTALTAALAAAQETCRE